MEALKGVDAIMSASKYPRPGFRIAPASLHEVLEGPQVHPVVEKLCGEKLKMVDLDESTWTRFGDHVCRQLAAVVLSLARRSFPPKVLNRHLPTVHRKLQFENLELEARTMNCVQCLVRQGMARSPSDLRALTIGQVLEIPGLGVKSLVDLLTSLETLAKKDGASSPIKGNRPFLSVGTALQPRLSGEAKKIQRLRCARLVRLDDPRLTRFSRLLVRAVSECGYESSTMLNKSLYRFGKIIAERNNEPKQPANLAQHLRVLRKCALRMTECTVEEELTDLAQAVSRERTARMAVRYFGWDGGGSRTLQTVGKEFRVTRERVRQVVEEFKLRLPRKGPFAPVLGRAIDFVTSQLPGRAKDIELALAEKRLTGAPFCLEGLVTAGQLLHRPVQFRLDKFRGERFVIPEKSEIRIEDIEIAAKLSVRHCGISTVVDVTEHLRERMSERLPVAFVRQVLECQESIVWLDRSLNWFWLSAARRNPLINRIAKVLAVCPRIRISELQRGTSRRIGAYSGPPQNALLEFCRHIPICRVEGEEVIANGPIDRWKQLSGTELVMLEVLSKNGPLLRYRTFQELCQVSGMKGSTFTVVAVTSPVVCRYARALYGIIGKGPHPSL
jgi:hypothetical protein